VIAVNSPTSIVVAQRYNLSANQAITIADPDDLHECGTAVITKSPVRTYIPGKPANAQVDLSAPIDGIRVGSLVYLPKDSRSPGIQIMRDTVTQSYARGIYFSGVTGAKIIGNYIDNTASCGILGQANKNIPGNNDITIQDNVVNGAFGWGFVHEHGGIELSVSGSNSASYVNKGFTINNNRVTIADSAAKQVGIFIANTRGYSLLNNSLKVKGNSTQSTDLPAERKVVKGLSALTN
jgi:hypothetical protein